MRTNNSETKMFNQNTIANTKIAVLEERLSSYETMIHKIDEAIQVMGKTSQNMSKMIAIHEERIDQCHRTDDSLIHTINELKTENKTQHDGVSQRIKVIEDEVKDISKIKWMTIGCGTLLMVLVAAFASLASGLWTPSEMRMQHQGHNHTLSTPN